MKPKLDNVTLVCIDCINYGEALTALRKSMYQVDFARAIFLTDIKAYNPNFPFEVIKIDKINNKQEYSQFIIKELHKYIETDFALVIQHDGYVLDGNAWHEEYLSYDYIGAPWLYIDGKNVGNGGFSLRSKKLLKALGEDDFIQATDPEDQAIGRLYRDYLENKHDIKFAPEDIADTFSYELKEPICNTFGFHGKFHPPYKPTVVVRRAGALGDIIATEPLLEYYHNKGYNVAIDMPIHLCMFFGTHFYPIKHISQLDGRIKPEIIDLNNSYEKTPKQLHLKSYYETAGITGGEIKNPRLKFPINEHNKLFKKYVVLHVSSRDQNQRNIYGIKWHEIVEHFNSLGYTVIQVGMTRNEKIDGAIEMTTQTTHLLLYVVAGADFMIGIDSSVSNMAVACNVPAIVFFGSVNPEHIYPNTSNMLLIHRHDENVCEQPFCWSNTINSVTGTDCYLGNDKQPCTQYDHEKSFEKIKAFLSEKIV